MNNTLNQLNNLRLPGMADALTQQNDQPHTYEELSFLERLSLLVNSETTYRDNRKITRLLKQARLRLNAHPAGIDYRAKRGLSKDTMAQLLQFDCVSNHRNILIAGPLARAKLILLVRSVKWRVGEVSLFVIIALVVYLKCLLLLMVTAASERFWCCFKKQTC